PAKSGRGHPPAPSRGRRRRMIRRLSYGKGQVRFIEEVRMTIHLFGLSIGSFRCATSLLVLSSSLVVLPSCTKTPDLNFEANEGAPCQDCSECDGLTTRCTCSTCTSYAHDPASKTILSCGSNHRWNKVHDCPGGAGVRCSEHGGYLFDCFAADGGVIP